MKVLFYVSDFKTHSAVCRLESNYIRICSDSGLVRKWYYPVMIGHFMLGKACTMILSLISILLNRGLNYQHPNIEVTDPYRLILSVSRFS